MVWLLVEELRVDGNCVMGNFVNWVLAASEESIGGDPFPLHTSSGG
jgi:hypothetical protein